MTLENTNLFENEFVQLKYNPEHKIIGIIWLKNPSSESEYKKPFNTLLKSMEEGGIQVAYVYSDTRKQGIIPPEYRKWTESKIYPLLVNKGMKRVGAVTDSNIFTRYYINTAMKTVKNYGIPMKVFNTEEKIIDFLLNG